MNSTEVKEKIKKILKSYKIDGSTLPAFVIVDGQRRKIEKIDCRGTGIFSSIEELRIHAGKDEISLEDMIKIKKVQKMDKFYIKAFDDYHDIIHYGDSHPNSRYKAVELGCFPEKDGPGYCRYFGLFYIGRKPSSKEIFRRIKREIDFKHIFEYGKGQEEECTLELVLKEIKDHLKDGK